ncbi:hypothetical protein [Alteraurantiacibacter buctensis]|uniref:Oligosaccharide repeat unit polymerase n=1 Tax=Alteraurantiacibacter buctensis TaxID=1503981 RepID=A0A844YYT8_9SPHN|nr:hypothetical protein [Alteraurantiacibacter buctensis]MXO71624.1 hypothetical protein [Alteraurantiacibacter buctensis]
MTQSTITPNRPGARRYRSAPRAPARAAAAQSGGYILPGTPPIALLQATFALVVGCLVTGFSMPEGIDELAVYRHCSMFLGLSLAVSLLIQARGNLRRLIRADVVALCAMYFLTFAEFLNPDVRVLFAGYTGQAQHASWLVLATMMSIAVGRHLAPNLGSRPFNLPHLSLNGMLVVAVVCFFLGYLWPLITVNFNPVSLVTEALGPRFSQPWQRGRTGDWSSFLTELSLLHYAFAGLVGVIMSGRQKLVLPVVGLLAGLFAFMCFMDFAAGTRYILMIKLGLAVAGYVAGSRKIASMKLWIVGALSLAAMWFITGEMLRLREVGLTRWIEGDQITAATAGQNYFLVDNNMITIARALQVFPNPNPFPGADVVLVAITKWVPRVLWPGKPAEWGTSLEQALGLDGSYTLAVTLTGEAYLIAGLPSLIVVGLLIGMATTFWNRKGETLRSNLDLLLYISAFFAAAICMRSLQFVTVAILPTVMVYIMGKVVAQQRSRVPGGRRYQA